MALTDLHRAIWWKGKLAPIAVDDAGDLWYLDTADDTWKRVAS